MASSIMSCLSMRLSIAALLARHWHAKKLPKKTAEAAA